VLCPLPFLDAAGFPQQKILHDEFAFAARQRSTASAARYFTISRLRAGFDFDDVVESLTIRALEERLAGRCKARRFATDRHGNAPSAVMNLSLRKSTGSNNAAKLPAEQQHLRFNDLRKFRCSRKIYPPGPGTKHRTVRSPFK
jgi:hypothetical protein